MKEETRNLVWVQVGIIAGSIALGGIVLYSLFC